MIKPSRKYASAEDRWAGLGPYYAMFPTDFANQVVARYSKIGDTVLDPFAGRGTALFSSIRAGRKALGIEVNPVGWIYTKTKLDPAPREEVLGRITDVEAQAFAYRRRAKALPEFFHWCFSLEVRSFLMCARSILNWRDNDVDRTAMAFLLTHLHGKSTDSLSNQMRQTKAMSPQYAIDWWQKRRLDPPQVSPVRFFEKKLAWRYAKGVPGPSKNTIVLGDSTSLLPKFRGKLGQIGLSKPSLMLTSPPYLGITNYHYDQWIRLWLLGGPPTDQRAPTHFKGKHQGKFANSDVYATLLKEVFEGSAQLLRKDAVIYVRTDRREPTVSLTRDALKSAFPSHALRRVNQPLSGKTQTRLFGHYAPRLGEVDFILNPASI
jgi:hypothetical protein